MGQAENNHRAEAIEERAAAWLAKMDRADLNEAERAALEAWMSEDARHRVAWLRLHAAWSRTRRLSALKIPLDRKNRPVRRDGFRKAMRKAGPMGQAAAGVTACALLLAGGHFAQLQIWGQPHTTEVGGRMVLPLSDGSRVELNTDTRVRIAVNGLRRVVWVDRGEAFFSVAPDANNPFLVRSAGGHVRVVGTRFSVRRISERTVVNVSEGRVEVAPEGERDRVSARRGDRVVMMSGSADLVHLGGEAVDDELSWRQGRLLFRSAPLSQVAEGFNRYNTRKLRIQGEGVAQLRIGGAFEASNVISFASALQETYGLRVEIRDGDIFVSE